MKIKLRYFLVFVSLIIANPLWAQANAPASNSELLTNPRRAVHTFLHWQQKGHINKERYATSMTFSGENQETRALLAEQLKRVLDARGLLIDYDAIPDNPNYADTLSGLNQYILFSSLPEVYLTKTGNQWAFSESTINQIPSLYRNTFSSYIESVLDILPDWAKAEWLGIQLWQYVALFVWVLIGFILRKLFEYVLENYVRRLTEKTSFTWDDELIIEIQRPSGFIFLSAFYYLTYTNLLLPVIVNSYLVVILKITLSIGFIWLLYNLADVLSKYLATFTSKTENKLDDQLVPLIRKTLRFFIVAMGVIVVLQNNGYNVASLIAGLGIGGLAFALAARDTLANFFGSITILLDKPFRIGDWVKIGGEEGTVEEVGFRSTRIRTFYNSLISVPNSKVADTSVDNLGLRKYRRLKTVLNLTYSTTPEQMEAFVEGVKAIVKANKHMRQDFYEVHFNSFGAHSLDVLVYVFFDVPDWSIEMQQRHNFLLEVLRLSKEVGVEFAFPTQTLQVDSFYQNEPRKIGEDKTDEELASTVYAFGPKGDLSNPDGIRIFKDGEEVDFGANT